MKFVVNFFLFIINLINIFFDTILNRDFRGLHFDKIQANFTTIEVEHKSIKIFTPNSILSWRVKLI